MLMVPGAPSSRKSETLFGKVVVQHRSEPPKEDQAVGNGPSDGDYCTEELISRERKPNRRLECFAQVSAKTGFGRASFIAHNEGLWPFELFRLRRIDAVEQNTSFFSDLRSPLVISKSFGEVEQPPATH